MDPTFWHERWQKKETAFHQGAVNDLLQRYWAQLGLSVGSTVFVPLCGKSVDMVWLAEQGHRVIGAELSQIAIDDFFAERGLTPAVVHARELHGEIGRSLRALGRRFLRSAAERLS
jgi:thiopurine S-methyltransferase